MTNQNSVLLKNALFLFVGLVFLLTGNLIHSKKLASLPEVAQPFKIKVSNNQLFVSDHKSKLHLYSLRDFKYVKQISRQGDGPQEYRATPFFSIYPDYLFIYSSGKGLFFSRNGLFKKEFKTIINGNNLMPVGDNFVFTKSARYGKSNNWGRDISIYTYSKNDEFKYKKMIYYYESPKEKKSGGKTDYLAIQDYLDYVVCDNKAFIADSSRGLFVKIVDSIGNEIGRIKLTQSERIKVDEEYKRYYLQKVKQQPDWGFINSAFNLVFPEYYPSFYRFAVDSGKIYFLTYNKKNGNREIIITDFKGNILKQTSVPWIENEVYINFSIENDKFYYIIENDNAEEWELHMVNIN